MGKYSFQTKKEVVTVYLNGNKSYNEIAALYKIPSSTVLKGWVHSYKEFGNEGLLHSRKNASYSFQFKLHVVELYLSTEVSYQELALTVGINNPSLITRWVNDFRIAGPDALRPKKKGRKKILGLTNKTEKRTFHSVRGWAYQMKAYSNTLKSNLIYQSMSRKGNCYDNSIMENFFGVMKQEMYYGCVYYSYEDLKEAIEKYIDYYNNRRIKQKLSWMSPIEYRLSQVA